MKHHKFNLLFLLMILIVSLTGCLTTTDDEGINLGEYQVSDGELLGDDIPVLHRTLFHRTMELIPDSYESRITVFRVFSDGTDETMAYVTNEEEESLHNWVLALDLADSSDPFGNLATPYLEETIIHEFGHLLSLNDSQIIQDYEEDDYQQQYINDEGLTNETSYLNQFFQTFWSAEYDSWLEAQDDENAVLEFYARRYTDFVTDYAATNVEEDFAESFRFFVTEKKPELTTTASEKILFFYEYPELIELRSEIRKAL